VPRRQPRDGDDLAPTASGGSPSDATLEPRRRTLSFGLRDASARVLLGCLGAALLLVVVGVWWVVSSGAPRSAEQTVDDFFQAQRDGDCEALIDLVTERSWSNGGQWSRDEFLDYCADAVEDYEPPVDQPFVSIYDEDGNYLSPGGDDDPDKDGASALAGVLSGSETWQIYRRRGRSPAGALVREDGEWTVETDDVVLRIGRSAHETVRGYLEAYNDGDCARLIGYLSEPAWSANGELDRDEFLDRCADAADARQAQQQPPIEAAGVLGFSVQFEVNEGHEVVSLPPSGSWEDGAVFGVYDRATVAARYELSGPRIAGNFFQIDHPEEALVVKDGLSWKLDGSEALSDDIGPGAPLAGVRSVELQALLPDEIQQGGRPCVDHHDSSLLATEADDQFELGVRRTWPRCPEFDTSVTLYLYADEEEARQAAEQIAGGRTGEPEALDSQVPGVPGIPREALGSGSTAVVAHEDIVVRVHSQFGFGDLSDAAQILSTQVERL
jgi:hypothetical protein